MGRLNKKVQKASAKSKSLSDKSARISKSDILKTLARKDKLEDEHIYQKISKTTIAQKKPVLPKTLDELDAHPDFQLLLLDKNTALQQLAESAAANDKRQKRIVSSEGGGINKIKKKDKMKMRKELLQKKIHVMKLIKEEEKAVKKRKRTVVTGDMKPISDTLDQVINEEIKSMENSVSIERKPTKKNKGPMKQKKVKASFMEGMSVFNQVNSHKQYIQDPFSTISTHIENKMLIEAMKTN